MTGYIRPVGNGRRISSWYAHINNRTPRSSEPGTDYYCPIGTPVVAPQDGIVGMTGDSINPPAGRYVFIKFDTGLSGRGLHLSRRVVSVGQRVKKGQIIGYSGASGYGTEDWSSNPDTGGAHIHWTFWPTHTMRFDYDANGKPYTLDPEVIFGGSTAGGGSSPFPDAPQSLEHEMILITAPGRSPALVGPGYIRTISPSNGSEFLGMAARLAERGGGRLDFSTDREYDVAKALIIQGEVPPSSATLAATDEQVAALAARIATLIELPDVTGGPTLEQITSAAVNAIRSVEFITTAQ